MARHLTIAAPHSRNLDQHVRAFALDSHEGPRDDDARRLTVEFETDLHALAFFRAAEGMDVQLSQRRATDSLGWEDWTDVRPGLYEAPPPILPPLGATPEPGADDGLAWRLDDAWVWDTAADPAPAALMARLALPSPSRTGRWAWSAVKIAWKVAGRLRDPRVQAVFWLAEQSWKKMQSDAVDVRARIEAREAEQRLMVLLAHERRARLGSADGAKRQRWQQYYSTLDHLIEINS